MLYRAAAFVPLDTLEKDTEYYYTVEGDGLVVQKIKFTTEK